DSPEAPREELQVRIELFGVARNETAEVRDGPRR
ncbi:MAG: hypothetical protein RL291_202, partial [Pseudomonadota bacterium]